MTLQSATLTTESNPACLLPTSRTTGPAPNVAWEKICLNQFPNDTLFRGPVTRVEILPHPFRQYSPPLVAHESGLQEIFSRTDNLSRIILQIRHSHVCCLDIPRLRRGFFGFATLGGTASGAS